MQRFSIVLGGSVSDFLQRLGLVRFALPNVMRRIASVVAVTWLPLLLLSLKDGVALGPRYVSRSFLTYRCMAASCSLCRFRC